MAQKWTEEKETELLALLEEGWGPTAIAKAMGTTKNAVVGKLDRRRKGGRPAPPKTKLVPKKKKERWGRYEAYRNIAVQTKFLENRSCRWPVGEPMEKGFHFCRKNTRQKKSFCPHHQRIGYRKGEPLI